MDLTRLFSGKKTYAAAVGMIVLAVVQWRAMDYAGAGQSALAALAAFGLRSALADRLGALLGRPATPPGATAPAPQETPPLA